MALLETVVSYEIRHALNELTYQERLTSDKYFSGFQRVIKAQEFLKKLKFAPEQDILFVIRPNTEYDLKRLCMTEKSAIKFVRNLTVDDVKSVSIDDRSDETVQSYLERDKMLGANKISNIVLTFVCDVNDIHTYIKISRFKSKFKILSFRYSDEYNRF
jgi:hypothetical protein